ncbi:MAG: calcium-translocating P-type ATPase, PMCA-type, partial [Myxococcales bacterium]|nr:calcium-translocating P-type ATPase, PMCA-type [Myxococcales bacterium]
TGESLPVEKNARLGVDPAEEEGAYKANLVLRSTLVADGHGALLVKSVGDATEFGQTARAAVGDTNEVTPLNHQLERLSKLIGVLGFSIATVTFGALMARAAVTGELVPTSSQWWFLAIAGVAAALASQRVWLPIVYDAKELLGRRSDPPQWLEAGGVAALARTTGAGIVLFGALLAIGILLGLVPADPTRWLSLEIARKLLTYFMIAVVIVVVAVPEGLAMSVTLSLAYSMRKMTASNNLVRRMHACETIGAATCICSDKTGTLTQNRMRLHAFCPGSEGASPEGPNGETPYGRLLIAGIAVNSTANLSFDEGETSENDASAADGDGATPASVIGNPTEGALLLWLDAQGLDYLHVRHAFQLERQWAFDTKRKFMVTVGQGDPSSQRMAHIKGAPEIVLERSTQLLNRDGSVTPIDGHLEALSAELKSYQERGMRTLGVAVRELGDEPLGDDPAELAQEATWLGFFAIADPVRDDVPGAVKAAQRAGIEVKIVTGDVASTAAEIGRQIGLGQLDQPNAVMTGPEFGALDDDAVKRALPALRVLSRARPADKMRLVQLLQEIGHVVAVTGDGTNDAPALNHANVGLAMGKSGTSIAKEAADIVLLDDSFPSIVNAVKWGRSLYRNIQRFVLFQLTINVAACVVAMLGPFIGVELPLTVMQMLWVNLIMDTFAALALATEPPSDDVLLDRPRSSQAFIITKEMAKNILGTGGIFVVVLILLLTTNLLGGHSDAHRLTLFFNFFVFLQFWNLFNARTLGSNRSGLAGLAANPAFSLIAAAIVVGQFVIVQFGGEVFRTVPLSLVDWIETVGLASPVLIVGEILRWRRRTTKPS